MKQEKTAVKASSVPPKPTSIKKSGAQAYVLFEKENLKWMLIGLGVIILGFVLMSGGKSNDPKIFDYKEIYSFRRITLAPILIVAGFAIEIWAIMKKPKS